MGQYADDLAELLDHLDVKDATLVGHSTAGGEVLRYIARHGQKTCGEGASAALAGTAVDPSALSNGNNPVRQIESRN